MYNLKVCCFFMVSLLVQICYSLDNGLALTPPMGWMTWQRFRCIVDCETYPDECISEWNLKKQAQTMVSKGYLAAGYEYFVVDDCWLAEKRDSEGKLQGDPKRFPSGMKELGKYIHNLGLKFGMYATYGVYTCQGYPGSMGHLQIDSQTFADWEIDYLKVDACYSDGNFVEGYKLFGKYLNQTGRPIVYSCSWPSYQERRGILPNYPVLMEYCNLWRNWLDVEDAWSNVTNILDWFSSNQERIIPYHGPGHWNDPDMLIIGNYALSYEQSKAQMALWAILGAPLFMSVDLKNIEPKFKDILQNKDVIAINQDKLGIQGMYMMGKRNIDIWMKPIEPKVGNMYSYAIAFLSQRVDGYPHKIDVPLSNFALLKASAYTVENIYSEDKRTECIPSTGKISVRVAPSSVILLKATPVASCRSEI